MTPNLRYWVDLSDSEVHFIQQALQDERLLNYKRQPRAVQVELLEQTWNGLVFKPSVAVSSCSDAVFLALMALGIDKTTAVIVPASAFTESIEPIKRAGATPVFADVDRNGNLDLESVKKIWWSYPHIKAIVLVHMHGCPSALEEIVNFCRGHKIALVEDCRYAMGTTYRGRKVGLFGQAGCWSFTERPLIAGSGGMLCGDKWLVDLVRRMIQHDADKKTETVLRDENDYQSINRMLMYKPDNDFRMSESAATLVRAFLMYRLEQYLEIANTKGKQLIERLRGLDGVDIPPHWFGHRYHQFKVQVDPDLRSILLTALAREGVPVTQWGYRPVAEGLAYESEESMWPRASRMYDEQIMLFNDAYPLSIQSPEVIDWVADTFIRVFQEVKGCQLLRPEGSELGEGLTRRKS